MTPKEKYQHCIEGGDYEPDEQQEAIVNLLNDVYLKLLPSYPSKNFLKKLFKPKRETVRGLYLWGGVGIGKTWLMDLFYSCLPCEGKLRMHFHQFMLHTHEQLKQHKDEKNPLQLIAKQLAKEYVIICFDEFFVSDIADAMLLGGLFKALFSEGVSLVTTSNISPDDLYKGGISRDRFLPAIELLKQYTKVVHLESKKDYRLRDLQSAGTFLVPLGEATRQKMQVRFESLTDSEWTQNEVLTIAGRGLPTFRKGKGIVWFLFKDLCNIPRSQVDYVQIAKSFHTVLLSNVPKLHSNQTNEALYLINLVDVFYDAKVKLLMSMECSIEELYEQGDMVFEFQRTKSRLKEMQSIEYLQKPHVY